MGSPYPKPLAPGRGRYIWIDSRGRGPGEAGRAHPGRAVAGMPSRGMGHRQAARRARSAPVPEGPTDLPRRPRGRTSPSALSAELCDGWLPLFFAPKDDALVLPGLPRGGVRPVPGSDADRRRLRGGQRRFVVVPMATTWTSAPTWSGRPSRCTPGGSSAKGAGFGFDVFARMGYEAEATRIQELPGRQQGRRHGLECPCAWWRPVALVGPLDEIHGGAFEPWRESCLTTMLVSGPPRGPPLPYAERSSEAEHHGAGPRPPRSLPPTARRCDG